MPDGRDGVRWRHSLVLRLFALATAVAIVATAATAWLTVRTTAGGITEQQGDAVAAGARVEDALVDYAATHADWSDVGRLVARLAGDGNRITLVGDDGRVLADSADADAGLPPPEGVSSVIDALDVGPADPVGTTPSGPAEPCAEVGEPAPAETAPLERQGLGCLPATDRGDPPTDGPIAARAVGPFALDDADRRLSQQRAEALVDCARRSGDVGRVVEQPSGRSSVTDVDVVNAASLACPVAAVEEPFASEVEPLARVQRLVDRCLERRTGPAVTVLPDLGWTQSRARTEATDAVVTACLTEARRVVLAPSVAPRARLYLSSTEQQPTTFLDLSGDNRLRIAGGVAAVLLVALVVAAVAGRQLVRPLGVLATAAGRVSEGDLSARADVRGRGEIGRVATAFNTMAERRERAERLRKEMVGDVAHELRNPLTTMRGTLEAAQDGLVPLDDALLAALHDETLLLQHVVEDLRDLAAADAGELRLHRSPVRVRDLLDQVAGARAVDAAGAGVRLEVAVDGDPVVDGDALRLRQVVGNLVSNAVRHSGTGDVVELAATLDDDAVEIAVRDAGEGIADDDLPHVFDRFWRADPSRTRASGGSGLGLAIVRQLVEAHGGTVAVTSVRGEGSRFVVRLPRRP